MRVPVLHVGLVVLFASLAAGCGAATGTVKGGEDPDGNSGECQEGETKAATDACGLNGRGAYENQICTAGAWQNNVCVDPDACADNAAQDVADDCGLNNRGSLHQTCVSGQWQDGACTDDDECEDDGEQNVANGCGANDRGSLHQVCVSGQWEDGDCTDTDECPDDQEQDLAEACGINGRGSLHQTCVSGQWQDGDCTDGDECEDDHEQDLTNSCGFNLHGTLHQVCVTGAWEDGDCANLDDCENGTTQPGATVCGRFGTGAFEQDCSEGGWDDNTTCLDPSSIAQVLDLNPLPASGWFASTVPPFVDGSKIYFVLEGRSDSGRELWVSDGSQAGTHLVLDMSFGDANSDFAGFVSFNDAVFFLAAPDESSEYALWRTDGTAAGTFMMMIETNSYRSPSLPVVFNGALFFKAQNVANGDELWTSDGTVGGTVLFKDLRATGSSSPSNLTVIGSKLYFWADGGQGREPWWSDGTPDGTTQIADIRSGAGSSANSPSSGFVGLGSYVYFTATDGTNGVELWRTDGTALNTTMVKDICSGSCSSGIGGITKIGNTLYFEAGDTYEAGWGTVNKMLWKSDGTGGGTVALKDLCAGLREYASPGNFTLHGADVYFTASCNLADQELWKTNGSEDGTVRFDLNPGSTGSNPSRLTELGGVLYFLANDGTHGHELWKVESGDPVMVGDMVTGTDSPMIRFLFIYDSALHFTAQLPAEGIWKTDSSANRALVLSPPPMTADSEIGSFRMAALSAGTVLFAAHDGVAGVELWRSDGTTTGTQLVKDLYAGENNAGNPWGLVKFGDAMFFIATDATGTGLWRSNGTSEGTALVLRSSSFGEVAACGTKLYFQAWDDASSGNRLWVSLGQDTDTEILDDTLEPSMGSLICSGGSVYLTAADYSLWVTDGTPAGTMAVLDPDDASVYPYDGGAPSPVTGGVYFMGENEDSIWKAQGSEATLVATLGEYADPVYFTELAGKVYFQAYDEAHGYELWVTDGTQGGTSMLVDLWPENDPVGGWPYDGNPNGFFVFEGLLYFMATDSHGLQLWRSDGTSGGTERVTDLAGGLDGEAGVTPFGARLVFKHFDTAHGYELWATDDTAAGASLLMDINPGPLSSSPRSFVVTGNNLFFAAHDGVHGFEPWVAKLQ